jgi:hypothetical protein
MNFKASGFIIAPFILFSNYLKNFDYNVLIENIFSKKWVYGTKIPTKFLIIYHKGIPNLNQLLILKITNFDKATSSHLYEKKQKKTGSSASFFLQLSPFPASKEV